MIYYVEDDTNIRDLTVYALKQAGFEAAGFTCGRDFFKACDEKTPDLVLLDIMLPEMDGLEILRELHSLPSTKNIPVMMLTAKGTEFDKVCGLDAGADDYLAKPFATAELLARIRAMTRSQRGQGDNLLRRGNLTLDRASFELSTPTGRVRLPNKEFQMLEMLMSSPSALIPAGRFIETIWGLDSDVETNVVWVHISCLRRILAELQADVQIRAIRNSGYRLEGAP